MKKADIEPIVKYWTSQSEADLIRMGMNPKGILSSDEIRKLLLGMLKKASDRTKDHVVIWGVDGRAVSNCSLRNIKIEQRGEMHIHVWNASIRGKVYRANEIWKDFLFAAN